MAHTVAVNVFLGSFQPQGIVLSGANSDRKRVSGPVKAAAEGPLMTLPVTVWKYQASSSLMKRML